MYQSLLKKWHLTNQRVVLRADLNVPLHESNIVDDTRLQAIRPTLDYLLQQQCTITLLTHMGNSSPDTVYPSTKILMSWFQKHHYPIIFADTIAVAYEKSNEHKNIIILLENLRHWHEEVQGNDAFAQQLARLGDYFVQDAFGTLHKSDSSITVLPHFFPQHKRTIGFCVERECAFFDTIRTQTKKPFVMIMGGKKVEKITAFMLVVHQHIADTVLVCPTLSFLFLKTEGYECGNSFVNQKAVDTIVQFLATEKSPLSVLLPIDYLVAQEGNMNTLCIRNYNEFHRDDVGVSLGTETVKLFVQKIKEAHTIFLNGAFGFIEYPETIAPILEIIGAMTESTGPTIIAGGDSVAIARRHPLVERITHLSTGGGAAVAYLLDPKLPGLVALE